MPITAAVKVSNFYVECESCGKHFRTDKDCDKHLNSSALCRPLGSVQSSLPSTISDNTMRTTSSQTRFQQKPDLTQLMRAEFRQATPYEIQTQGKVTQIRPGLFIGHRVDAQNRVFFMGREKLSLRSPDGTDHRNQWEDFKELDSHANSMIRKLILSQSRKKFTNNYDFKMQHKKFYSTYNEEQLLKSLQRNFGTDLSNLEKKLAGNSTGHQGFYTGLIDVLNVGMDDERYVLYVSSQPITDFAFDRFDCTSKAYTDSYHTLDYYLQLASNISMVVSSGVKDDHGYHRGILKTTTGQINKHTADFSHLGIQKGGLSSALHLFGFACAKAEGLSYMHTSPVDVMASIIDSNHEDDFTDGAVLRGIHQIRSAHLENKIGENIGYPKGTLEDDGEMAYLFKLSRFNNKLFG